MVDNATTANLPKGHTFLFHVFFIYFLLPLLQGNLFRSQAEAGDVNTPFQSLRADYGHQNRRA